jgi:integrase
MASKPKPHGNGWRTQWVLKDSNPRRMQYGTVSTEDDCWKLKAWIEGKGHRFPGDHPDIVEHKLYLAEQPASSAKTFGQYADGYIKRRVNAREDTRDGYRKLLRRMPELCSLPLHEVTLDRVEVFLVDMQTGKTVTGRKYAVNTRRETGGFIRSVMLEAEQRRAVEVAPGQSLRPLALPTKTRLREQRFLTREEYAIIRAAAYDQQTLDINDLMVLTGMRIGEVLPLEKGQWERTEVGGFLDINRHVVRTKEKIAPGTKASRRAEGRSIWINECGAQIFDRLIEKSSGDLLVPAPEGDVWIYARWMDRRWRPSIMRSLGLGYDPSKKGLPTPHDLRHTHVDWCLQNGEDIYGIQGRLGHSSISMTIDQYGPRYKRWKPRVNRDPRAYERLTLPDPDAGTGASLWLPDSRN